MTVLISGLFRISCEGDVGYHLNLTLDSQYKDIDDDVKFELLQKFFYLFRKRVDRELRYFNRIRSGRSIGFKIKYCRVNTLEGNGVVHCIYQGLRLDDKWIRETWMSITGANITFIKELYGDSKKQAHYIASQYVTQQKTDYIYGTSRDWVYNGFLKDYDEVKRGARDWSRGYVNEFNKYVAPVDWSKCKEMWYRFLYGKFVDRSVIPQYMCR